LVDANDTPDAGLPADAGATDAGIASDAGSITDSGTIDAGVSVPVSNAGCEADGGGLYFGCATNADCACPLSCQTDPAALENDGTTVCLELCATSDDCTSPIGFCPPGNRPGGQSHHLLHP
jgi:hypothetical protein